MAIIEWNPRPALTPELMPAAPISQEQLNQEAAFTLGNHELIDPIEQRGHVSAVTELAPVSMSDQELPSGVRLFEISVSDPFVKADPEGYEIVRNHVEHLEGMIRRDGFDTLEERLKDHPYVREGEIAGASGKNRFTEAWLNGKNVKALEAWHSNVPTAEALGYLTDPSQTAQILDKNGEPFVTSPETTAHLRFVDDAVAIRNRGVAMEYIAKNILSNRAPESKARWLSLASGTGEPSIAASKHAADTHKLDIDLVVADINPKSLVYVKGIAEKYGFADNVTTIIADILDEEKFKSRMLKKTGTNARFTVVENMGFEEYLYEEGDELGAFKDIGMTQASVFTRMAYDRVEPGGSLISGNMVLDRPQRDFVFGIVNWPIINARSEESILRIYERAGIPMDQVKMYRIRDEVTGAHVYNIIEVSKPNWPSRAHRELATKAGHLVLAA